MLVFLEDTEKGGETIWPCPGKDSKGKPIKGQCQTAFDGGARWFNGKKAVVNGERDQAAPRLPPTLPRTVPCVPRRLLLPPNSHHPPR